MTFARRLRGLRRPTARPNGPIGAHRPVRTPTVLQMDPVECGAASLAMVLAHFRRHVSLQHLRVLCGVSRDGSKAGQLVRAARTLGLEAQGKQMSLGALAALPPPAILFWEFNHYVVWEGYGRRLGKTVVRLNDPAQGRRVLTPQEFSDGFTGVVLTFRPGPHFHPGGRRFSGWRDVRSRLVGAYPALAAALLASLLLAGVSMGFPALIRGFVDSILMAGIAGPIVPFFTFMAGMILLTALLIKVEQTQLLGVETYVSTVHSARFMHRLLRLPVSFFDQRSPADIAERLGMNHTVSEALTRTISSAVTGAIVVCSYVALLWVYDPLLTVAGVSTSLLNIALVYAVVRMRQNASARLRVERSKLYATAYSGLQLIETMKATGGEHGYFRRWGDRQAALLTQQQRASFPAAVLSAAGLLLTTLTAVAVLLLGGLRAIEGQIAIGALVAFQALLVNFSRPVGELINLVPKMQDTSADLAWLRDVETIEQADVFHQPSSDISQRLTGYLRFDNVTFGYSPLAPPQVRELSFKVHPGKQIALVGGSGSGKSTVSRLIAGFHDPWEGRILFDGRPQAHVSKDLLTASVAFVDQEIHLFQGTVRDNVTLWDPSIPDEAVMEALREAQLDEVVAARPGGIHSRVEQDGRNFSGGQRQRLELARAFVRMPSLLILDEATSALDAETETRIIERLRRRGCACVVIAHRLSTVRGSDEILVLADGRIVERGTHDELANRGGAYAALIRESRP
ncbi:NHLM bacteriocin system ABC transporter, peptidase/ATP-binding protein [Sinosporangium album]|uniref:NHLM bacteriocin system ABC transporter, peptidase/ATP-binding protein n=1 Tax=Sinosporangium album TaxID=504805 RepID=A0A1G8B4L5_9ACTN|nr:NHLP family bacteriocin export ABC transporter peptidase/permease/ATPase subunit [Sinosporangium album]SDH28081.1 NHLM bacteriocin system ABC transporter, peptidase/ATP-binding protein [Sinosporangium album]